MTRSLHIVKAAESKRKPMGALIREWKLLYLRWALREIHPLHDDVPYIVRTINELEAAR